MIFTSKDLAKAMGLKVGNKVKSIYGDIGVVTKDYKVDFNFCKLTLSSFVDEEFEILQPKKRVGDLICEEVGVTIGCTKCPLRAIYCKGIDADSLYDNLEKTFEGLNDDELYDILKNRLDKEVE